MAGVLPTLRAVYTSPPHHTRHQYALSLYPIWAFGARERKKIYGNREKTAQRGMESTGLCRQGRRRQAPVPVLYPTHQKGGGVRRPPVPATLQGGLQGQLRHDLVRSYGEVYSEQDIRELL